VRFVSVFRIVVLEERLVGAGKSGHSKGHVVKAYVTGSRASSNERLRSFVYIVLAVV
jgi:hypothetical protein